VWVGVAVGVGVGVLVGVSVGVLVGVRVLVAVGVGVLVGVNVGVATTGPGTETAPIAQSLLAPSVQDIVVDAAPAAVLPPLRISGEPVPVPSFQRCVWEPDGVIVSASPRASTVSKTRLPGALETVTLAVVEGTPPEAALVKPSRDVSCTAFASETDPAMQRFAAARFTVTVAVPVGGFTRAQISTRSVTPSACAPIGVSACGPYVTDDTDVVRVETPTKRRRLSPDPTV